MAIVVNLDVMLALAALPFVFSLLLSLIHI